MIKWQALKNNRCPKCNKLLGFNENEEMIFCNDIKCGFQISQYRMERLVTQMNNGSYYIKDNNFEELQNMARSSGYEIIDEVGDPPEWL